MGSWSWSWSLEAGWMVSSLAWWEAGWMADGFIGLWHGPSE